MKKKWLSLLLAASMCLSGCGALNDIKDVVEESGVTDKILELKDTFDKKENEDGQDSKTIEESDKRDEKTEEKIDENIKGVQPVGLETGIRYDYHYSELYSAPLADMQYPSVKLCESDAQKYPDLASGLQEYNIELETEANLAADMMLEEADNLFSQGYRGDALQQKEEILVRRADTNVVSLLVNGYYYGGGAHGSSYYKSVNIDAQTGERINLHQVVKDITLLPECIIKQLEEYEDMEQMYTDLTTYFSTDAEYFTWTIDYNGITFYFAPYELSYYAYGSVVVTLSFADYPNLFTEKYQDVPQQYTIELSEYDPLYYDLDGNGNLDQMRVNTAWNEEYMFDEHRITINGEEYIGDVYGYDISPLFVHTADGKNYLYIENMADSDDATLIIYKIENNRAVLYNRYPMSWCKYYSEQQDMVIKQVMTKLDDFVLSTPTDLLSTVAGYKNYHISAEGVPETEDAYYTFTNHYLLTLKQNLTGHVFDEEKGELREETTIPAGYNVLYYHTDGKTFADLKLGDGTIVRVKIDGHGWPRTINGVAIEEIFDGMMFAG